MQSMTKQFLDFCRSKPANEEYRFESLSGCAFCQFLRDTGIAEDPRVDYETWSDSGISHPLPAVLRGASEDSSFGVELGVSAIGAKPHSFGALASRLSNIIGEGGR